MQLTPTFDSLTDNDPAVEDTLYAEIESLRIELADRDRLLREQSQPFDASSRRSGAAAELSEYEEQIRSLTENLAEQEAQNRELNELLQAAESASQLADAERCQIERWLDELEQRMDARNAEREAEFTILQTQVVAKEAQLLKLQEELDAATQQLPSVDLGRIVGEMTSKNDELTQKLEDSSRMILELTNEIEELTTSEGGKQVEHHEDGMRNLHLQVSKERIEFYQQKSEFLNRIKELEMLLEDRRRPNEVDQRFAVFREHLRDIQIQEQSHPPVTSLVQFLATVWRAVVLSFQSWRSSPDSNAANN